MIDSLFLISLSVLMPPSQAESSTLIRTFSIVSETSDASASDESAGDEFLGAEKLPEVFVNGQDMPRLNAGDVGTVLLESIQEGESTVLLEILSSAEDRTDEESKPRKRITGKVVVTGPDGEKREYSLDSSGLTEVESKDSSEAMLEVVTTDDAKDESDENSHEADKSDAEETGGKDIGTEAVGQIVTDRWVIGVQCEETSELLRSHLKLGDAGLVILEVREETPASAAGLKVHDIIVRINDQPMKSRDQLIEAVLGSEGAELELSIIREGEPQTMKVTPRKMKVQMEFRPAETNLDLSSVDGRTVEIPGGLRIRRVHPGVMLEGVPSWQHDVDGLVRQLRELADAQSSEKSTRIYVTPPSGKNQQPSNDAAEVAELRASVKSLQEQVNMLKQSLKSLQKSDAAADKAKP